MKRNVLISLSALAVVVSFAAHGLLGPRTAEAQDKPKDDIPKMSVSELRKQVNILRDSIIALNNMRLVRDYKNTDIDQGAPWQGFTHQHQMENAVIDYMNGWHTVITETLKNAKPPIALRNPVRTPSRAPYPPRHGE